MFPMFKNYLKTAVRYLKNNKSHSFINISGLAVGMAVAILIGLWIFDELSFNKNFTNYDRIGQLWQFVNFTGEKASYSVMPVPLAAELRDKYPDFKQVSLTMGRTLIMGTGERKLSVAGDYAEADFAKIMSLKMTSGVEYSNSDVNSMVISATLAKKLFNSKDPLGQPVKLNNKETVRITGVYEDFPMNSAFNDVSFLINWQLIYIMEDWTKNSQQEWDNNSFGIYVQLKEGASFKNVSDKIKDIRMKRSGPPPYKPEFFIHPMSKWHLYSDFKNGVNEGGLIQFVWLFGIIGVFVLLLACINFMNLSTARSEKRAKEVGIRKTIGSLRRQLVLQFFSESLTIAHISFILAIIFAQIALPFFNKVSGKEMSILWTNPVFWILGLGFSFFTGLIAGSYPAIYLSSFNPAKVLKGTFKVGRFAAIPRKVLVVIQFTVSVILIIGTIVVFRQIQFAKNRPVGYDRNGLIQIDMNTPDLNGHYESLRNDLLETGAVYDFAESSGEITGQSGGTTAISWRTKSQDEHPLLMSNSVTLDYGRTIGWQLAQGRDFSRAFNTDTASMILNEAALKIIKIKSPLHEMINWKGKDYKVIGVIRDMVKESPFANVNASFFVMNPAAVNTIQIRLMPQINQANALSKIGDVFKKYNPESPFSYSFVDEDYGRKFADEERIGKLAAFFTTLAIFISCLGLFGVASFVAEQRTKEIGVRKVLGASVFNLWGLVSKEFVMLVFISLLIAIPTSYYFLHRWLENYTYKASLSWWIFIAAGGGALLITILTVSYQGLRAALTNPVRSLRTE